MTRGITRIFDLVLFGGSGDLVLCKLIPALYFLHKGGQLHPDGRIIAVAREEMGTEQYIARLSEGARSRIADKELDPSTWDDFCGRIVYQTLEATDCRQYRSLALRLKEREERSIVYYLATGSDLFSTIGSHLAENGLTGEHTRVILEKPLGHDARSAQAINRSVARFFTEKQTYRIDHYLGKEAVQNLLVLRFGNTLFESLWNEYHIDHVQITVAEDIGIGGRADFYEKAGALRDMTQNHLLQLLCFTAMEPPANMKPDTVRDEKLKVLRSLRPVEGRHVREKVVRGQYRAGVSRGKAVCAYREEADVADWSRTETFVAIKAEIDNWRWAGTPFYLRTGKRMAEQVCEIVVQFKGVPHSIFGPELTANKLIIRVQPDEGIQMVLSGKKIGAGMEIRSMKLDLSREGHSKERVPEAYERLLSEAIAGRTTLFMRRDELDAAWQWVEPILKAWETGDEAPLPYTAGSWGPSAANLLLARDNRLWHEEEL